MAVIIGEADAIASHVALERTLRHDPWLDTDDINISAPDPGALARFYQQLLGWEITVEEPHWVSMRDPDGGVGLAFQPESFYARPVWPAGPSDQQMMMHLEIRVDDLERAGAHASGCGATLADHQPQEDVRDPES